VGSGAASGSLTGSGMRGDGVAEGFEATLDEVALADLPDLRAAALRLVGHLEGLRGGGDLVLARARHPFCLAADLRLRAARVRYEMWKSGVLKSRNQPEIPKSAFLEVFATFDQLIGVGV
jgi:hypothetical protein